MSMSAIPSRACCFIYVFYKEESELIIKFSASEGTLSHSHGVIVRCPLALPLSNPLVPVVLPIQPRRPRSHKNCFFIFKILFLIFPSLPCAPQPYAISLRGSSLTYLSHNSSVGPSSPACPSAKSRSTCSPVGICAVCLIRLGRAA